MIRRSSDGVAWLLGVARRYAVLSRRRDDAYSFNAWGNSLVKAARGEEARPRFETALVHNLSGLLLGCWALAAGCFAAVRCNNAIFDRVHTLVSVPVPCHGIISVRVC